MIAFAGRGHEPAGSSPVRGRRPLLFFFLYLYGLEVLSLEDLAEIETLDVVDPISSGDDLGAVMVAGDLHD